MKKIDNLGAFLNKYYFEGKMPKCATMADMSVLTCVYNELSAKKQPEFISASVKTILENLGFIVAPKGIGWIVIC